MHLPMDDIQAFVMVAELGSFSRAAERLGLTQTGLTRRIQRLEAYVGLALLDRTTRRTGLTAAGRDFLPLARRVVEDLTHGLQRLRTTSRLSAGDVTLATMPAVAYERLPQLLAEYARRHPGNRVMLLERSGSAVTEAVRSGAAEFGIHIMQAPQAELEEDLLSTDPLVLVCHPSHPLAGRGALRWAELAGQDLITLGGSSGNRAAVEQQLAASGLSLRGRFVVENTPSAMALAATGIGVAILPSAAQRGRLLSGLVEVPLVEPALRRSLALVRRRGEALAPAAAALHRMIRESHVQG
ncbi:LysR family transcriptional regulator [Teichococcus cervicalis]|uniref:Putative bacteriochlorophyll 4-vinyl reductase n=1 Tax=Pseudoroseomonas cervicalis ATCC 49957 TaxID=525371 RepID=D5RN78_9PROT|nr:LysR family transcriptional regulator [Pseudoroseomonas cervicalis]EFH11242.1 putative bacteriochlorophyll 4-vinyl reductase [Pseudoroseomonas cervicalis ATCC 49957]